MRVLFDTNILIRAAKPGKGPAKEALTTVLERGHVLLAVLRALDESEDLQAKSNRSTPAQGGSTGIRELIPQKAFRQGMLTEKADRQQSA